MENVENYKTRVEKRKNEGIKKAQKTKDRLIEIGSYLSKRYGNNSSVNKCENNEVNNTFVPLEVEKKSK